jgi:GMP synthase (glutamine-hydrolysing)
LTHVPFEGPANIGRWAVERGHALKVTNLYDGQSPPEPNEYDFLVVMGGPMNIYDYNKHPWLSGEKKAIEHGVTQGKAMLGVCLGAQLMAHVLGGPVSKNPLPEIGWLPVDQTPDAKDSPIFKHFPERYTAFHWHGDTFALPPGATLMADTQGCANQAFVYGGNVVGLQFHIETTVESMEALIENCAHEIVRGPYVQDAETMRAEAKEHLRPMRPLLYGMLDAITREAT